MSDNKDLHTIITFSSNQLQKPVDLLLVILIYIILVCILRYLCVHLVSFITYWAHSTGP